MFHFAHLSLISSLALQIVRTIITSGVKYFSLLLDRFDLYYNELLSLVSLFIFVVSLPPLLIYISPLCVYSQFTFQLLLTFPFYLCPSLFLFFTFPFDSSLPIHYSSSISSLIASVLFRFHFILFFPLLVFHLSLSCFSIFFSLIHFSLSSGFLTLTRAPLFYFRLLEVHFSPTRPLAHSLSRIIFSSTYPSQCRFRHLISSLYASSSLPPPSLSRSLSNTPLAADALAVPSFSVCLRVL